MSIWLFADYACVVVFRRHMKIVVSNVAEIVKMLQKHMDPKTTQKLFKLA